MIVMEPDSALVLLDDVPWLSCDPHGTVTAMSAAAGALAPVRDGEPVPKALRGELSAQGWISRARRGALLTGGILARPVTAQQIGEGRFSRQAPADGDQLVALSRHPLATRPPMSLRLIGGLRFQHADQVIFTVEEHTKPTSLLLAVALGQGKPTSRQHLRTVVWDDVPATSDTLKKLLRRMPDLAEKVGAPDDLLVGGEHNELSLNSQVISFDLDELERMRELAVALRAEGDWIGGDRACRWAVDQLIDDRREGGLLPRDIRGLLDDPGRKRVRRLLVELYDGAAHAAWADGEQHAAARLLRIGLRQAPRSGRLARRAVRLGARIGDEDLSWWAYSEHFQGFCVAHGVDPVPQDELSDGEPWTLGAQRSA